MSEPPHCGDHRATETQRCAGRGAASLGTMAQSLGIRTSRVVFALALGCTGAIEAPPAGPVEGPERRPPRLSCDEQSPGRSPLQRLTRVQYDHAVQDLFGDATRPGERWIDGERGEVNADARIVSTTLANQYLLAAEDVSERATADLPGFLGCEPSAACVDAWLTRRGRLIYRRPLTADEHEGLGTLYRVAEEELGPREATRAVVEAMLQSPAFLYRVELPSEDALASGAPIVRLGAYALASRLAFALWQTTPDATLLARAEAGELDDDEGVAAVAREMLADPRAEAGMLAFFDHYLDLGQLDDLTKDPATFPDFDETIPPLLRQETEQFLLAVFRSEEASWEELLTADWTMMNGALSAYYGLGDVSGPEFERVALDGRYHAGLLTQGSIAASRGRATSTDPVHRGMFVRGKLLCGDVPDVPEGLQLDAPDPDPTLTYREQLEEHRSDPVCASCHVLMDSARLRARAFRRRRTLPRGRPRAAHRRDG